MTGAPNDLLTECEARGIRLALAGDGGLSIDAPQDALTPDLLRRLRAHKPVLLRLLATCPASTLHHMTEHWRDGKPAEGRIRTTCRHCGAFIGFRPVAPASRN